MTHESRRHLEQVRAYGVSSKENLGSELDKLGADVFQTDLRHRLQNQLAKKRPVLKEVSVVGNEEPSRKLRHHELQDKQQNKKDVTPFLKNCDARQLSQDGRDRADYGSLTENTQITARMRDVSDGRDVINWRRAQTNWISVVNSKRHSYKQMNELVKDVDMLDLEDEANVDTFASTPHNDVPEDMEVDAAT